MVWYSHLSQNFPQFIVIHTVKGFGIVNKLKIDVFLELCCFFHDPADVGNLISGSSAFSKTSLNIREFTVHVLLKPGFTSMWDEYNCAVVWAFFCIAFLWNWNENWPFQIFLKRESSKKQSQNVLKCHGEHSPNTGFLNRTISFSHDVLESHPWLCNRSIICYFLFLDSNPL